MRLINEMVRWAGAAGLVMAATAFAQPEQWLQYHISGEGRSYRWLEITTNAPAGVALPKLGSQAYFARWTTPLDPSGGRWLCFERTRKSGPWNRVFVDRNGNGRLDDEQAVVATRTDEYSAYFEPLRLRFKGEDGPLTYHLVVRFMKYDNDEVRLLAWSGCYYAGKVDLGGKKRLVTLVDGNVNGVFNDIDPNPFECDRILVDGDKVGERFLGRMLELDNTLFALEVARDGAALKIKKAENVTFGQVRVPEGISDLTVVGKNGHFVRKPAKGESTLPVGNYRIQAWSMSRKDSKGALWKLSGSDLGEFGTFDVTAGKPATVEVGEPVRPVLSATEAKGTVAFGLRLKGRLGESVDLEKDGQRPKAPRLLLTGTGGTYRSTNTFEYG
jgi:hypothetical protein